MRLPPISPDHLTAEQRPLFDEMSEGIGAKYAGGFVTTREDGALLGPWNAWLHDPELGTAFWQVTKAMTNARRIPNNARQVAILVIGARFNAAYELYAHAAVGRSKHAMSERRLVALAAAQRPDDLTDEEAAAHDFAVAMLRGGPLPDLVYANAFSKFGQAGVNELVYLVGHYCFVSMTLNGFAITVP
jgi:4-carboxymuconolactone decarboxylase